MSKNSRHFSTISCWTFLTLATLQFSQAAVVKSPLISDNVKENFEQEARIETIDFLNNMFTSQIEFFNHLKGSLKPETKRYQDIEQFVEKLKLAKDEQELEKKDTMYWDSFKEFNKSPLLLNEFSETNMTDEEFTKALADNGIKELLKNFFADVAIYFLKMAKASGKVVEVTMDEYIEQIQNSKSIF